MSSSTQKTSLDQPLIFTPYFRPQVWGGRRLQQFLGKPLPPDVLIGEAWELSAQTLHVSRIQSSVWHGITLTELWNQYRPELLGKKSFEGKLFPWLIKWLDCSDRFSVQVHPDDAIAKDVLQDHYGKTESWVIVHAEPTARVYAGLKAGVSRQELAARSQDGTVAECLHSFSPQVGDCIHIPAGTVHAASGGVLMAEVQQTSDATFRLFDWNRVDSQGKPRTLHLEQALSAIHYEQGPIEPVRPQLEPCPSPGITHERLVHCPNYVLDRFQLTQPWNIASPEFSIWIALQGELELSATPDQDRVRFRQGDVVLVPASVPAVSWKPIDDAAVLLRVTLP